MMTEHETKAAAKLARLEAELAELRERAANEGYRVCAETRHVSLGDKVRAAILALSAPSAKPPTPSPSEAGSVAQGVEHSDDLAVDRFAAAMKAKLAKKRAQGRGGWEDKEDCTNAFLSQLVREHVGKGDPVDVGALAMMIHQREERIASEPPSPSAAVPASGGVEAGRNELLPCPFCGSSATMSDMDDKDERRWFVRSVTCDGCDATVEEAISFGQYARLGREEAEKELVNRTSQTWNSRIAPLSPATTSGSEAGGEIDMTIRYLRCADDDLTSAGERLISTRFSNVRSVIQDAIAILERAALAKPAPEPAGDVRENFPRLTDAMIRAACMAHYGSDEVDGIAMTVRSRDYNFRQAFKRMWKGAREAALSASSSAKAAP